MNLFEAFLVDFLQELYSAVDLEPQQGEIVLPTEC